MKNMISKEEADIFIKLCEAGVTLIKAKEIINVFEPIECAESRDFIKLEQDEDLISQHMAVLKCVDAYRLTDIEIVLTAETARTLARRLELLASNIDKKKELESNGN